MTKQDEEIEGLRREIAALKRCQRSADEFVFEEGERHAAAIGDAEAELEKVAAAHRRDLADALGISASLSWDQLIARVKAVD